MQNHDHSNDAPEGSRKLGELAPRIHPLSELRPGQEAVILRIEAEGAIRQRLLEMGFVCGEHVRVKQHAPLGDPMELVLMGYHLSLRREECACIWVELEY